MLSNRKRLSLRSIISNNSISIILRLVMVDATVAVCKSLLSFLVIMRPQFVLFGDSLTQQSFQEGGWGAALQNQYLRQADIVLRGYSGYNTRWAKFLLNKVFPKEGPFPALVTVFFGANDAALADRQSKRQHVPLPEYKQNLLDIISHIKNNSESTKIIIVTPPPVDEPGRLRYAKATYGEKAVTIPERENEVTKKYAQVCLEVGKEANVASVDLWTKIQEKSDWQNLLSDGLHFTREGNQLVFGELIKEIENNSKSLWIPSLIAPEMKLDFPWHNDIDENNPEIAFN